MNVDIVRKIKRAHLSATFQNLKFSYRFFLWVFLLAILIHLVPHEALAAQTAPIMKEMPKAQLVFDISSEDYLDFIAAKSLQLTDLYEQGQIRKQALRQAQLADKVRAYLQERNSPLADYAATIVSLRNWKKILALANAESTLCRRYPVHLANCWGIGGSNLWDMGDNLGEGVVSMNYFLENYPTRSAVKYSEMSFERMNGFYKQPAADHWVVNNKTIYHDLEAIEASIQ